MTVFVKGKEVQIDEEDLDFFNKYPWWLTKYGGTIYVVTYINKKSYYLHRLLLNAGKKLVDHKDGNGLNNQRANLRFATKAQNAMNRLPNKTGRKTSKFKGVWRSRNSWIAGITLNNKCVNLGSYRDEVEAAKAYDRAALEHYKEFARTNKMMGLY